MAVAYSHGAVTEDFDSQFQWKCGSLIEVGLKRMSVVFEHQWLLTSQRDTQIIYVTCEMMLWGRGR